MVLRFKCIEQRLICENACALAANSINHVSCAFTLDDGWNGYVITAVFDVYYFSKSFSLNCRSIAAAACLPAPIARITVAAPVTASPPA